MMHMASLMHNLQHCGHRHHDGHVGIMIGIGSILHITIMMYIGSIVDIAIMMGMP